MNLNIDKSIETISNLPLCKHSTFRIGGNADLAVFPKNKDEFISVIRQLKSANIRFDVIGNASNILFDDNGYRGVLIFTSKMNRTEYIKNGDTSCVRVECGKSLVGLASETLKKLSLKGLEFAYGIPGSVGGAVYMNAGAYGGEMKDVVIESTCYDAQNDTTVTLTAAQHKFAYRKSIFAENKNLYLLSTTLRLTPDENGEALARALENMESRRQKQPLEYPNAGSTFKRPDGYIAAKLIDDCGLKGLSIGDACVSQKHAGFLINQGNATSRDVLTLADKVRERVNEKFGVSLELEIIYIPEKQ